MLSRDGSIEQRQLEELLMIQSFRVRVTLSEQCAVHCWHLAGCRRNGVLSSSGCRLRQLTRSLRLQKGVCAMAERESSYPGF